MGILQIEELQAAGQTVFWVNITYENGTGGRLAEFMWRCDALHFATDYAARYGARLRSADVIPFRKVAAA